MASQVPAIWMPSSMLLHIFTAWPAPEAPAWKTFFPINWSSGRAVSRSPSEPPTMKVSVPASAPPVPPETGASSMPMPFARAAAATSRAVPGSMVLQSTSSASGRQVASTPPASR